MFVTLWQRVRVKRIARIALEAIEMSLLGVLCIVALLSAYECSTKCRIVQFEHIVVFKLTAVLGATCWISDASDLAPRATLHNQGLLLLNL